MLVHGAWSSGSTWTKLSASLSAHGHRVYAPTLTGLGERAHLGGPEVSLSTHIHDVVELIEFHGLERVILVGASYGGMVVAGAADRIPERIAQVVFLDAFVPRDGDSCLDLSGGDGFASRDGWKVDAPPFDLGPTGSPRRPQPVATLTEKIELSRPLEDHDFGLVFVKASHFLPPTGSGGRDPDEGPFSAAGERARGNPAWRYYELYGSHILSRDAPGAVLGILLDLSASD